MNLSPTISVERYLTGQSGGYNLSVADFGGLFYYAYRYHPEKDSWRTQIIIVKAGEEKPLIPPTQYLKHSLEDLRLFTFKGKLMASVTVARSRVTGQSVDPCISAYGILTEDVDGWYLDDWTEPKHADNTWSKQTKNTIYFDHNGQLMVTWATTPAHTVHWLDGNGKPMKGWRTEAPVCPFGSYRGGTQAFNYKGNLLRFCHAVQNNPKATQYWGYALAAYVFQPEPPFRILKVSQQPILAGNEAYEPNCPHWKPRICIPYGAVKDGDGWQVAVGLNDCESAMVYLTEADLNL